MAADEIRVLAAGPVAGEVLVRGRLVDRGGQLLAGFQQTTRITWGSRVIELDIKLDPQRQPDADPWNSYYAARFAWGQDAPTLYRSVNQATVATDAAQLESPHFVEIRGAGRTHDGPHGGPALSSPSRPAETRFAVDRAGGDGPAIPPGHRHRLAATDGRGVGFRSPSPKIPVAVRPKNDSAWLFHLDSRSVISHALGTDPRGRFRSRVSRAAVGDGGAPGVARAAVVPHASSRPRRPAAPIVRPSI